MKATKVKAIAVILVIFALGLILGWAGGRHLLQRQLKQMVAEGSPPLKEFFMKRMSQKLDLTDAQKAEIITIVSETEGELYRILHTSRVEFADIMGRMITQVKTHLTPEQQQDANENFRRFLELWQIPSTSEEKEKPDMEGFGQ